MFNKRFIITLFSNSFLTKFVNSIIRQQVEENILKLKKELIEQGIIKDDSLCIYSLPIIKKHPDSTFIIGDNCTILNNSEENIAGISNSSVIATTTSKAKLIIGNHVGISGACICCMDEIIIGDYVNIGVGARIYDTDFHPINFEQRRRNPGFDLENVKHGKVEIKSDVWIGANVLILKGVTIGERSIIAAGSVVTKNIPSDCVAGGNPAVVIKSI